MAVAETPQNPAGAPVDTQIEMLVRLLPQLVRVLKAQWRGLSLTGPQMGMLEELQTLTERQGGAHPGELADRFCLSSPAVTAALDELVEKGYCRRSHSEQDRRKVLVQLTPVGALALAEAQEGAARGLHAMLAEWDSDRLARLLAALRDLDEAAGASLARGK